MSLFKDFLLLLFKVCFQNLNLMKLFFHLLDEMSSVLDPAAAPGKILAVWAIL